MTRRGSLRLLAGSIAALALAACGSNERMRYKMTVEVETPSGVKSGHAIREVRYSPKSGTFFAEGSVSWKVRGEAVAVDIAPGKPLFALLTSQDGQVDYAGRDVWLMLKNEPDAKRGKLELWPRVPANSGPVGMVLPMLVTFRDVADPKSVERVDPADLTKAFGPGVRLRRITVEVADDAVTTGVDIRLQAIGMKPDRSLDNDFEMTTNPTLAQRLGYSDFRKELK